MKVSRVSARCGRTVVTNVAQQVVLRVRVLVRHFSVNKLCHVEGDREVYNCGVLLNKEPVLSEPVRGRFCRE